MRASDHELLWANPKFEEMFGHAGGSQPILEPAAPVFGDAGFSPEVAGRLENEGRVEYDIRGARADGAEMWCRVRLSSYEHPEHGLVWLAIQDDVTDARRLERERGEALTELERSNAELEQYAYVASHDLGEPLRVVSGFVQLLQRRYDGKLDADADRFITATVNGVNRMQAMIDALLAYSRVGRAEVEREQVDMTVAAHDAIAGLQAQIEEAGAEIHVGELPVVRGDRVLLGQVHQNLISNAVKFTNGDRPGGGDHGRVGPGRVDHLGGGQRRRRGAPARGPDLRDVPARPRQRAAGHRPRAGDVQAHRREARRPHLGRVPRDRWNRHAVLGAGLRAGLSS